MDPRPRLSHSYRVRFDEAGADGRLQPSGILRYAQDMAWRHSEEAGFGRAWYDERGMHWLVRDVVLEILAPVSYGDQLQIGTEVTGWRHVWARRQAELALGGTPVARVETDWVLLRDDGQPARVPEEIAAYFAPGRTFERHRVVLPEPPDDPARMVARVRPADVDPLQHMNNAAYLDLIDETLALMPRQAAPPGRYRIGYLRPAQPGMAVHVACWPTADGGVACRVSDDDDHDLVRALVSWPGA